VGRYVVKRKFKNKARSTSTSGHTHSVSFQNGKTINRSTMNNRNGSSTIYTSISGSGTGKIRSKKTTTDDDFVTPLIVLSLVFFTFFALFASK